MPMTLKFQLPCSQLQYEENDFGFYGLPEGPISDATYKEHHLSGFLQF